MNFIALDYKNIKLCDIFTNWPKVIVGEFVMEFEFVLAEDNQKVSKYFSSF